MGVSETEELCERGGVMPWDYTRLVAIHYSKGLRYFIFYERDVEKDITRYTGCHVDDGREYAQAVVDRYDKRLAPRWVPEGAGFQTTG